MLTLRIMFSNSLFAALSMCNGEDDCPSGVDEDNCPDCEDRHGVWVCGGVVQCRDVPCVGK